MEERNVRKAQLLYDFLDNSSCLQAAPIRRTAPL